MYYYWHSFLWLLLLLLCCIIVIATISTTTPTIAMTIVSGHSVDERLGKGFNSQGAASIGLREGLRFGGVPK